MASFDTINYSLRPSKGIQRQLIFEGVRQLQSQLDLEKLAYIGFGSIWFSDFIAAHKILKIDDMVSIEGNEVGYQRALFNVPFATIRVMNGLSNEVLPTLLDDHLISNRPWLIWLDYDYAFCEANRDDSRLLIESAPQNSILIVTFNAHEMEYGRGPERPDRLRQLFGSVVPDDLSKNACKDDRMQETLANLCLDYFKSVAADLARPGGFLPAFRILYKDAAPMVTVGGILPAKGAVPAATSVVANIQWPCKPPGVIIAPNLTIREASVLQSQLPCESPLTRTKVKALGFDLEESQIETFQRYYKQYPAFAQVFL